MGLISFVQSIYLDESILRKESLYGLDSASAKFFFEGVMQIEQYILIFFGILLIIIIPRIINLAKVEIKFKKILVISCLGLILILPQVNNSYFDNIYVNTISQTYETHFAEKMPVSLENYTFSDVEIFENSIENYSTINLKNNTGRVLVFVMESVAFEDFINQQNTFNNKDNFFELIKNHSHLYSNYYTTNQDSRTAVMTILSSTFIPFEAYTSFYDWKPYFGYIENRNNLIEFFNEKNFKTYFVISSTEITLESEIYHYDEIINIKNYSEDNEEFLCLNVFEFQHGCEDKFLIEDVKKSIKENEKLFLFQEFVYGHGVIYNKKLKKTNFEYYNEYLVEIYTFLKKENLLENTTIIVTSDHGLREKVPRREVKGYNVPLVVYNLDIDNFERTDELLSHVNFKDVLLSHIGENISLEVNEKVYFVGPTSRSLFGVVYEDGSTIVKENTDFDQLIFLSDYFNYSLEKISSEINLIKYYKKNVKK